jgi:hypothetical protein
VKLVLAIDMVAMVKLLLGTATLVENLLLAMAIWTMEKVSLAIAMLAMEANGLDGCSSGSHTYNTSTATGGESNKGCSKVYS